VLPCDLEEFATPTIDITTDQSPNCCPGRDPRDSHVVALARLTGKDGPGNSTKDCPDGGGRLGAWVVTDLDAGERLPTCLLINCTSGQCKRDSRNQRLRLPSTNDATCATRKLIKVGARGWQGLVLA
jgi:hypothetical protein